MRGDVYWTDFTPHKAMANQIRTVTKARLARRIGSLTLPDTRAVEQAIRVQLGLL